MNLEKAAVGYKINKRMNWIQSFWIACLVVAVADAVEDTRRPIWNVAHMVNALYQVDNYLDKGANSLEFDVAFDWKGNPLFTFHGVPCDCFRRCMHYENIDAYIEYLQVLTTPGNPNYREELVLLFMDLKVQGLSQEYLKRAGENLGNKLLDLYWKNGKSGAEAYVLFSMPSVNHVELIRGLQEVLFLNNSAFYKEKIGFDFSGNEDLNTIHSVLDTVQVSTQIWQGDGITNCLPRGTWRLLDAIKRRDYMNSAFVDKVYWWTVDKMSTMRKTLSLGVDGMITNYPHRLIEVMNEDEFSDVVRLANIKDNPWRKHPKNENSIFRIDKFSSINMEEEILYNS